MIGHLVPLTSMSTRWNRRAYHDSREQRSRRLSPQQRSRGSSRGRDWGSRLRLMLPVHSEVPATRSPRRPRTDSRRPAEHSLRLLILCLKERPNFSALLAPSCISGIDSPRGLLDPPNFADVEEALFLAGRVVVLSERPAQVKAEIVNARPYPRHRGDPHLAELLQPSVVASRFEALRGSSLTRLVGRDEEIDLLLRRWARAKAGDGQVVLISGEPRLGKSRITGKRRGARATAGTPWRDRICPATRGAGLVLIGCHQIPNCKSCEWRRKNMPLDLCDG